MQQSSSHDCDVVIVNYNAGLLLTECVQSVLVEQARHVFVVDNDSHDDSLAHLSASTSDVRVTIIRNGQNLGFAAHDALTDTIEQAEIFHLIIEKYKKA